MELTFNINKILRLYSTNAEDFKWPQGSDVCVDNVRSLFLRGQHIDEDLIPLTVILDVIRASGAYQPKTGAEPATLEAEGI